VTEGLEPNVLSPSEFAAAMQRDAQKWKKLVALTIAKLTWNANRPVCRAKAQWPPSESS
jgi:hypothetical protein